MKLYTISSRMLLLALFVTASLIPAAQAQTSDDVFKRLKAKYDGIETLRAEFDQTMTSEFTAERATSSGVLFLENEKYRVETKGQTFVTNGDVTWVYLPSENQVLINDYVEDESTFSISEFFFNYEDRYDASQVTKATLGGAQHYVLTLKPKKKESFFSEVTLSMRASDAVITRLQVVDVNGTTMRFDLKNIQINPSLERSTFNFTPPSTAEIIDLRS